MPHMAHMHYMRHVRTYVLCVIDTCILYGTYPLYMPVPYLRTCRIRVIDTYVVHGTYVLHVPYSLDGADDGLWHRQT